MPLVTRRLLASAALSLLLGLLLGLWMLLNRELLGRWPAPYVVSSHTHLVLVGTVMQVIAGVALWMFPLPRRGEAPVPERLGMLGWWLLTPGTLLRAGAELARAWSSAATLAVLVVLGAVMQVGGMVVVVLALRRRIRPVGAGNRATM